MKPKKKLKKKVKYGFICIFILLLILVSVLFYFSKKDVKEMPKTSVKNEKVTYVNPLPEFRKLYQNDDIVAQIEIPSLDLKELIVKGTDNDYYMNHDLNKKKVIQGAIFMDYRTADVDKAKQINIYGHNSEKKDLPFSKLEKYQAEEFFLKSSDIILNTDKATYKYKVFIVSIVSKDNDEHMLISAKDQEFLEHVAKMRENALYDTKEQVSLDDDILILQTCLFNPEKLLLIIAKK